MNTASVYHHSGGNFCYALDRDTLRISIRTGEDIAAVTLVWGDPFKAGILGSDVKGWTGEEAPLTNKRCLRDGAVWWSCDIKPPYKRARYFFRIKFADETVEANTFFAKMAFTQCAIWIVRTAY